MRFENVPELLKIICTAFEMRIRLAETPEAKAVISKELEEFQASLHKTFRAIQDAMFPDSTQS